MINSVLLFSNTREIEIVTSSGRCKDLSLKDLDDINWLKHFCTQTGTFKNIPEAFNFNLLNDAEVFVLYDGEFSDPDKNKLNLSKSKLHLLEAINLASTKVHIVFHSKPSGPNIELVRDRFPMRSEEFPLPIHKHSKDGKIFSELFNTLWGLNYDENGFRKEVAETMVFFEKNVSTVQDIVNIVFERAEHMKLANFFLQYLFCCMSKETIIANSKIINDLSIFPKKYRKEIFRLVSLLRSNNYLDQESPYHESYVKLSKILNEITTNNRFA